MEETKREFIVRIASHRTTRARKKMKYSRRKTEWGRPKCELLLVFFSDS